MNSLKGKYGVYIALCKLIVTIGIFMMGSDKVFADDKYVFVPVYDNNISSNQPIVDYGVNVRNNQNFLALKPNTDIYVGNRLYNVSGYVKICGVYEGDARKFLCVSNVYNYVLYTNPPYDGIYYMPALNSRYNDLYYYYTDTIGTSGDIKIPSYTSLNAALQALDDGINAPELPHDPEYSYDNTIGSLVDVQFKNVIDETGESNFLDISYSRYTSTGKDLYEPGYGIMSRLVYNDPEDLDSIISFPEFLSPNITDSTGKKALKLITWGTTLYRNAIADSIADLFSGSDFNDYRFDDSLPGGGGHSFEFSQMDPYYDVILTPYYYDGSDYYYGDNTVINGVYFDQLGTRLVDDPDSDQTISITNVTINNYDYGVESQYINNGDITNIDSLQVYNYTTYVTDNSQTNIDNSINNTYNSTTNIYNNDNNYKPFGSKNLFDGVTAADLLRGLQSVITAFAMAFPIIGGLFDYLPWWAVDIAFTCTVVLAAMGTLKVLNIGNKINIGDLIGGGGS